MSQTRVEPAEREAVEDKTLGELVALASRDVSHLVRSEIELAKAEVTADIKRGGLAGGMFGGAGFFGYLALLFLSVAAAFAIAMAGLPYAAAFGIVGGAYVLLAGLLALLGAGTLRRLDKVRRTKRTIQDTRALLRREKDERSSVAA